MDNFLPDNPSVRELRSFARGYGLSLPSRMTKASLEALAESLRFASPGDGTVADIAASIPGAKVVGTPCRSCGETTAVGYDLCDNCQRSLTASDQAWRDHHGADDTTEATTPESPSFTCAWFATCVRPAAGHVHHPVLGDVATCAPCASKLSLTVTPF